MKGDIVNSGMIISAASGYAASFRLSLHSTLLQSSIALGWEQRGCLCPRRPRRRPMMAACPPFRRSHTGPLPERQFRSPVPFAAYARPAAAFNLNQLAADGRVDSGYHRQRPDGPWRRQVIGDTAPQPRAVPAASPRPPVAVAAASPSRLPSIPPTTAPFDASVEAEAEWSSWSEYDDGDRAGLVVERSGETCAGVSHPPTTTQPETPVRAMYVCVLPSNSIARHKDSQLSGRADPPGVLVL
jgi:hypothetical protein